MVVLLKANVGRDAAANDNSAKPRGCPWTALIVAMRTISPECEALAWVGRRSGLTVPQFCDRVLQYAEVL